MTITNPNEYDLAPSAEEQRPRRTKPKSKPKSALTFRIEKSIKVF